MWFLTFRGLKKWKFRGNEEVFRLVKDSIDSDITKEDFDRLFEILIKNQSVKRNEVGNRECLSLPKESVQHDSETIEQKQTALDSIHATVEISCIYEIVDSIQDTEESSQDNEKFTQYKNYEVSLNLKLELEHLKLQIVKKIKNLFIKEQKFP